MKNKYWLYFGWWVVTACIFMAAWQGGINFGFTAFVKPIADDLTWSYLAISFAVSLRNAEMGLLAPVAGILVDKIGPGKVAFWSGLITGAGFLLLSQIHSLALFYIAFICMAVGMAGFGHVTVTSAVADWFKKRLGMTTGIVVAAFGLGGLFIPPIAWLIDNYEWRTGSVVLGLATWIIVLPSSLPLWRKPKQNADILEGELSAQSGVVQKASSSPVHGFSAKYAAKTKVFWILTFAFTMQYGIAQAATIHIMPYAISRGLSTETSALIAMLLPLTSIVGRLGSGWLSDRFGPIRIFVAGFFMLALGMGLLYMGYSIWYFVAFLVMFGPAFGGILVLRPVMVREYFGMKSFGTIQGFIIGIMTIGGILGPSYAGWTFDNEGGYQTAWLLLCIVSFCTMLIILLMRRSIHKPSVD